MKSFVIIIGQTMCGGGSSHVLSSRAAGKAPAVRAVSGAAIKNAEELQKSMSSPQLTP